MLTKLTTEVLRDGRLIDRREQRARSFTRGFIELLYLAHAQIDYATPHSLVDALGVTRDGDCYYATAQPKGNMRIPSSSGQSEVSCPTPLLTSHLWNFLPGEVVGIQIGVGTTAVAPDDRTIEQRVFDGKLAATGAGVTFESLTAGDTEAQYIYGANYWSAQSFRALRGHRVTSVKLKLYRTGSPGTVNVGLIGADRAGNPTGSDLAAGTTDADTLTEDTAGEWREITFATPVEVYPGFTYVILVKALSGDGSNVVWWRDADTDPYPRGNRLYTANGGSTWTAYTADDFMFEEIGEAVGQMDYEGCGFFNVAIANPNGEFSIRRLFSNNCGSSITLNEVGIYSVLTHYATGGQDYAFPILIARDIVSPGVAVADGQVLGVTYTPQITV